MGRDLSVIHAQSRTIGLNRVNPRDYQIRGPGDIDHIRTPFGYTAHQARKFVLIQVFLTAEQGGHTACNQDATFDLAFQASTQDLSLGLNFGP